MFWAALRRGSGLGLENQNGKGSRREAGEDSTLGGLRHGDFCTEASRSFLCACRACSERAPTLPVPVAEGPSGPWEEARITSSGSGEAFSLRRLFLCHQKLKAKENEKAHQLRRRQEELPVPTSRGRRSRRLRRPARAFHSWGLKY